MCKNRAKTKIYLQGLSLQIYTTNNTQIHDTHRNDL